MAQVEAQVSSSNHIPEKAGELISEVGEGSWASPGAGKGWAKEIVRTRNALAHGLPETVDLVGEVNHGFGDRPYSNTVAMLRRSASRSIAITSCVRTSELAQMTEQLRLRGRPTPTDRQVSPERCPTRPVGRMCA